MKITIMEVYYRTGLGVDIKRNEDGNYSIPCGLGYLDLNFRRDEE